jgi:hypothetical protein
MNKRELFKIVEFCVLMQGNDGILGKAPSYIEEKYRTCDGSGILLDNNNHKIFQEWKQIWLKSDK